MAVTPSKQTNLCANEAKAQIYFEGDELCFNYKTGQWSAVPAYDTFAMYTLKGSEGSNSNIGLIRYNGNVVNIAKQSSSAVPQTAVFETGSTDVNQGGRSIVRGVRPLVNGGDYSVRVGVQDSLSDSVTWSSSRSVSNRTGMANFRSEGRYVRTEVTIEGGFTTAQGVDVDVVGQGRV